LHAAALRCAEGVCAAIRAGEFWPPNEQVRADRDEFATLFHHGVAASVTWGEARP
jgi:ATP-dependent helicase/nuclease subunit B